MQQPIELGHSRNSDFGLLSGFGLRSSDFRAAEHDLPSTGRTLEQPWPDGFVEVLGLSAFGGQLLLTSSRTELEAGEVFEELGAVAF